RFGEAVESVGRLNGDVVRRRAGGGVYRPPVGALVSSLSESPVVYGAGQSSWGPTVYGVTDADHVDEAVEAGRAALADADIDGSVSVAHGRNRGASVE
ncbi:GHMP kinase, partial [Haloferax sp. AB510]|nr:GHMP kinase [Haloferax sp. AB510]